MGQCARTRLQIQSSRRNLLRRLPAPAQGNGKVQRLCRRCLEVHGTATTSTAVAWAYRELMLGAPTRDALTLAVRRAMVGIGAIKIARSKTGRGRPWIWGCKN
jgi:hypothetical protein